ncbi:TPA: hypothetical protein L0W47_001067 [Acinetobacter baumannii]|uniref:Uncharacterized protein n=1 Tax=Acinetobacter baumannii 21072 TaxID=1310697 RepID=A0A062IP77_ACIBA|nr:MULTISPECIES: hypothetical protein [Acinetobacter calcoaceticus/baumannii complex]CAH1069600.1 Uncharacterised protein [Acinetobacter phage MD-2021a]ENV92391.1 hypothetical protein F937_01785 [Acinetobacter calcoaceticus ANC 3680]KCY22994.1 hypothetical protein J596_0213 [Acinetobacter baumannii 21072]NCG58668.1 hypothetical protein [Acinetobacter baumannii]NDW80036.1 hypothetical protein [Acinetobacter baumannii]
MCGPGKVVQSDPEAEAQLAAEKATQETNKKKAQRNLAKQDSVLASSMNSTVPNNKTTLGGG